MFINTFDSAEFKRIIKAVALGTQPDSKGGYNRHPYAIQFTYRDNGGIQLAATDNYRIALLRNEAWSDEYEEQEKVTVMLPRLLKFVNMIRVSKKHTSLVRLTHVDGAVSLEWDGIRMDMEVTDRELPDTSIIFTRDYSDIQDAPMVKYNPLYLADAGKACSFMAVGGYNGNAMEVTTHGHSKPTFFTPQYPMSGYTFQYALMPIRFAS